MEKTVNKHDYAIDVVKFIAVLMITNSHFRLLYEDVNPALATLGVHGNALFFFASGLTLAMSKGHQKMNFLNWYKCRWGRIMPTIIVWAIISNCFFDKELSWSLLLYGNGYWFLKCILVSYIPLYFILKAKLKSLYFLLGISSLLTVLTVFLMPKAELSIFHAFHYIAYFSVMIMGVICVRLPSDTLINIKWGGVKLCFSFALYFVVMSLGKGNTSSWLYYTQLIGIIPLHFFVFYFYSYYETKQEYIRSLKIYKPVYWIGSLCLEIYIVQGVLFTNKFNSIFPLNLLLVFAAIVGLAYFVRIMTNLFGQCVRKETLDMGQLFKI